MIITVINNTHHHNHSQAPDFLMMMSLASGGWTERKERDEGNLWDLESVGLAKRHPESPAASARKRNQRSEGWSASIVTWHISPPAINLPPFGASHGSQLVALESKVNALNVPPFASPSAEIRIEKGEHVEHYEQSLENSTIAANGRLVVSMTSMTSWSLSYLLSCACFCGAVQPPSCQRSAGGLYIAAKCPHGARSSSSAEASRHKLLRSFIHYFWIFLGYAMLIFWNKIFFLMIEDRTLMDENMRLLVPISLLLCRKWISGDANLSANKLLRSCAWIFHLLVVEQMTFLECAKLAL